MQQLVRQGVEIASYERAASNFAALTKLPASKSSLQRLVGEEGGQVVVQQAAEAEAMVKTPERDDEVITLRQIPKPDSDTMAMLMDGVKINIREEGWKEVRLATVSAVERQVALEGEDEPVVHLTRHSYRAGLWEAKEFAKHQWAEGCRRGLQRARRLVAVGDGAAWIWLIVAMCYAPCVEIIDWWHALEKLWAAANSVWGQGESQTAAWMEQQEALLWMGRLRAILAAFRQACPRGQPFSEAVRAAISYVYHNRKRMAYEQYRQAGYPTGSGAVESACKVVVQARMKQAGMRWSRSGAQAMLALRCMLLSDRWDDVWSPPVPASQLT